MKNETKKNPVGHPVRDPDSYANVDFLKGTSRQIKLFHAVINNLKEAPDQRKTMYEMVYGAGYTHKTALHKPGKTISAVPGLKEALEAMGINADTRAMLLLEMVDAQTTEFYKGEAVATINDNQTQLRARELLMKVFGDFAPEKIEGEVKGFLHGEVDIRRLPKPVRHFFGRLADAYASKSSVDDGKE